MNGKRGQFYLLAAIIIITVIIGFAAYSNYTKKKNQVKVYDLGDELGIESGRVINHGVVHPEEWESVPDILEDFTKKYAEYAEGNLYFVFGNNEKLFVATYEEILTGTVSIGVGENSVNLDLNIKEYIRTPLQDIPPVGGKISVSVSDVEYEFELKPGENFYFIIYQEIEGERFVAKS